MSLIERIRDLCRANGITIAKLEVALGFGNGSLAKGHKIQAERLLAIANYFGVSMEYLLGAPEPGDTVYSAHSIQEKDLLKHFRQLDDKRQQFVLASVEYALKSQLISTDA